MSPSASQTHANNTTPTGPKLAFSSQSVSPLDARSVPALRDSPRLSPRLPADGSWTVRYQPRQQQHDSNDRLAGDGWSLYGPVVATRGNQRQIGLRTEPRRQAKTVAVGLRPVA